MKSLAIAQYPEISPPTVTITANYPGANAETVANTVAAPIEEQLSGIPGLLYYSSTASANGSLSITVTFAVGTDPDQATINVSNQVQIASNQLPSAVTNGAGVIVKQRSSDILNVIALNSSDKKHDALFLSNYATINLVDDLKRLPGVGDVTVFGQRDYAMRVWLQPDRMTTLKIASSDVIQAIQSQNLQYATGRLGDEPALDEQMLIYTLAARGRLSRVEDFENIIIRAQGGSGFVRLKDVARVELAAQNYTSFITLDGQSTLGMALFLQSGANALDVKQKVIQKMDELKQSFPQGLDYLIPFDTTLFISASIEEVIKTLLIAALLVVLVVYLFLQNVRATLIPLIAVPVSIIGTFAALWLFGFSINTLTLFAMVLSIGIVVDDAIVVLENVERLMKVDQLSPLAAAERALSEVSNAVVAIVLVLCAVFVPVAFLGGIPGQLYRQFALTVAASVVLSGFVALTLTPTLCALLLKAHNETHTPWYFRAFNQIFDKITQAFVRAVQFFYRQVRLGLLCYLAFVGGALWLYHHVPQSFVPSEDQGYLMASLMLPNNSTLQRTTKFADRLQTGLHKLPEVKYVLSVIGFDLFSGANKTNSGTAFIPLKPWDQRKRTADDLMPQLSGLGFGDNEGLAIVLNPPPIRGLGSAGGFEGYIQARGGDSLNDLSEQTDKLVQKLKSDPRLEGITSFFNPHVPRLALDVDLAKALSLDCAIADVYQSLQSTISAYYVNDFNKFGRTYQVQVQAEAKYRSDPRNLNQITVRSATGQMVPLGSLVHLKYDQGPELVDRYNGFIAAHILGNSGPGVSSAAAIKIVEDTARDTLKPGYSLAWTGAAFQENASQGQAVLALSMALVVVYLILSAQYESWRLPGPVLLSVPFALFGALALLYIKGQNFDIYFQIGLVVLIGLAAKNAILIIEFAHQNQMNGLSKEAAVFKAARLRFRPIVMTSLAFIFGVLPLALATGAGAGARRSMGVGVLGGMLLATFVAPLFVPLFWKLCQKEQAPAQQP